MDCSAHLFGRSSALSFSVGRSILVELLTKDQARRIACDDGGSRKDKRPNHQSGRLAISQCFYFDFFCVLLCFFAMALLLDDAPILTQWRITSERRMNQLGQRRIAANIAKLPDLLIKT